MTRRLAALLVLAVAPWPAAGENLLTSGALGPWVAKDGAPAAEVRADGVYFPCPFTRDTDRFYWDAGGPIDLGKSGTLVFELTPENATAGRTLSIYFESGDGWYHWSEAIRGRGRQRIRIAKATCDVEDRPGGWARIKRIRFAPWMGRPERAGYTLHSLTLEDDKVLLVRGTSSLADRSERALSRRTAERFSDWLTAAGIEHGAIDDEDVIAGSLRGAKVAILCYNADPPAAELTAIKAFLDGGGKLIVCFGANGQLARWMNVRIGRHEVSTEAGRWSTMHFQHGAQHNLPERVNDTAWSTIPAWPLDAGASVIATWEDAAGGASGEPACIESAKGYWLTHVPRGDDPEAKAAMVMGMVGNLVPELWRDAAKASLAGTGVIPPATDVGETVAMIRRGNAGRNRGAVEGRLGKAAALHRQMARAYGMGRYATVRRLAGNLDWVMAEAYGLIQKPRPHEMRGVWDHDGVGLVPGDWAATCRVLSDHGINAVFPNLSWPGKCHYPSALVPTSRTAAQFGDQLAQCVRAARAEGMAVHVWKVCWNLENASPELIAKFRREGRLQRDVSGNERKWLSPSHPDNVQYELAAIRELVRREPIHGVHLDYIRYPDSETCYSDATRRGFEEDLGTAVASWPQAVLPGGRLVDRFQAWRTAQITAFVRQVNDTVREVDPSVQVSAAVYRRYPSCRDSVGQDWAAWLREGIVDFVCPMNYTEDEETFRAETVAQLALPRAAGRVVPGIGVGASDSQLSPDQVIRQIRLARESGAPGYVPFDLSRTLQEDILPVLRMGITAPE